jgi:DnaJ-class molecular chaperone
MDLTDTRFFVSQEKRGGNKRMETCPACGGYKEVKCPKCDVKVRIRHAFFMDIGASNCSACRGEGVIMCSNCAGSGFVSI